MRYGTFCVRPWLRSPVRPTIWRTRCAGVSSHSGGSSCHCPSAGPLASRLTSGDHSRYECLIRAVAPKPIVSRHNVDAITAQGISLYDNDHRGGGFLRYRPHAERQEAPAAGICGIAGFRSGLDGANPSVRQRSRAGIRADHSDAEARGPANRTGRCSDCGHSPLAWRRYRDSRHSGLRGLRTDRTQPVGRVTRVTSPSRPAPSRTSAAWR